MHWIVGLKVDLPEYVGAGDSRRRIPNNWKQIKVTVRLAKEHSRDGWTVDDLFVEPSPEDIGSPAPYGRAPSELVLLAACRGIVKKHGADAYVRAYECDGVVDPEPVANAAAEAIDITRPLKRSVLESMKFFTLRKHVQALTGQRASNKENALEILASGNLIAA